MKNAKYPVILLSILMILTSFNLAPEKALKQVPYSFPSSLKLAEGEIVLFLLNDKDKKNETLKKEVSKGYHGEHLFVSKEDLTLPIYENIQVYRYVFTSNRESSAVNGTNTEYTKLSLEDRYKGVTYHQQGSVIYKLAMKSYSESLEYHRLKFGSKK